MQTKKENSEKKENAIATTTSADRDKIALQGNLDDSDMIIPYIKIVQAMSTEAKEGLAKEGDIYNSITNETKKKIELVVLSINKKYEQVENNEYPPACVSFDLNAPNQKLSSNPKSDSCKNCEYRKFGVKEDYCYEAYNVLALEVIRDESGDAQRVFPIKFSTKKRNNKAVKEFVSACRLQNETYDNFYVELATTIIKGKGNNNYPVFKKISQRPIEQKNAFTPYVEMLCKNYNAEEDIEVRAEEDDYDV